MVREAVDLIGVADGEIIITGAVNCGGGESDTFKMIHVETSHNR